MITRSAFFGTLVGCFLAMPSQGKDNAVPLAEYLTSMDRTEVTFIGRIRYNISERDFTFYNEDREPFGVTMDAGRDMRERVETECGSTGFMITYNDLCTIRGSGTVEIRGSRIFISIDVVDQLGD